jgi:hypothetical protein
LAKQNSKYINKKSVKIKKYYIIYNYMNKDIIIILLIFFTLIVIFGLLIGGKTSVVEKFIPEISSSDDIESGASELYKWDLPLPNPPPEIKNNKPPPKDKKCRPKDDKYHPKDDTCNENINNYDIIINNKSEPMPIDYKNVCQKCDITSNKDIDKYVLKASIPPCPNMSDYVTKSMLPANNVDLNNYILKSEIKPCPNIDMEEYIKKSEIKPCMPPPKCPECPTCPECPICPKCPAKQECATKVYNYKISEHPDYQKYTSNEKFNECTDKTKELDNIIKAKNEEIENLKKTYKEGINKIMSEIQDNKKGVVTKETHNTDILDQQPLSKNQNSSWNNQQSSGHNNNWKQEQSGGQNNSWNQQPSSSTNSNNNNWNQPSFTSNSQYNGWNNQQSTNTSTKTTKYMDELTGIYAGDSSFASV